MNDVHEKMLELIPCDTPVWLIAMLFRSNPDIWLLSADGDYGFIIRRLPEETMIAAFVIDIEGDISIFSIELSSTSNLIDDDTFVSILMAAQIQTAYADTAEDRLLDHYLATRQEEK